MKLDPIPFAMVASGKKTIELRLYDEKRRMIKVGDEIRFLREDDGASLDAEVLALYIFKNFEELYRSLPLSDCGYTDETVKTASYRDMETFYPPERQREYRVVGIKIQLKNSPPFIKGGSFLCLIGTNKAIPIQTEADRIAVVVDGSALGDTFKALVEVEIRNKDFSPAVRIHFRHQYFGTIWDQCSVDSRTANDKDVIGRIFFDFLKKFIKVMDRLDPIDVARREHDVDTVFEGFPVREGQKRVPPHDDDLSRRRFAEKLHVFGKRKHQIVLFPDAPLFIRMKDRLHGIFLLLCVT